jgi:steroid delta-isomerase-like uncharacterized protein
MSEQDNINIVRKEIDGFNSHNLDMTTQYLADRVMGVGKNYSEEWTKDRIREVNQHFLDAYPDLRFEIKDIIAQGDKVVVYWHARGTHKNALQTPLGLTIPPTNKTITVPGMTLYELRNGRIVRESVFYDQFEVLMEEGLLTPQSLQSMIPR